ncbi:hypothetical protein [Chryseolinea lacunae]|uniref:DUF2157 domain-containing protein n=1 Tax=Chryseolinea lacunae TaxID=2801331 RepID=A0ABS1L1S1_9BACT|nr:hypothetical protein [Chryseolinea lacunae]MBL0745644.1 hypothetical protein [Chryseolinea lacunae]
MISEKQRDIVKELLIRQGLTFKPLLAEMIDHTCCEIEEKMAGGMSFEEALKSTLHDIPDDHFVIIQRDTVESMSKRFTLLQWLSYLSLGLLFLSVVFKIFQLQFGGQLLLLSFVVMAVSLVAGSVSGLYWNRKKTGRFNVLGVVLGTVLLMIGYGFRLLHLAGADTVVLLAVVVTLGSLVSNTFFIFRHATGEGNLLTHLHEKYTPGIERFLLLLLLPLTLFKTISIVQGEPRFAGGLVLLVIIFGAGLQLVALLWRAVERNAVHRNPYVLAGLIVSFTCFVLVFLGNGIPVNIRMMMIATYSVVSAWLAFKMEEGNTSVSLFIACFVPVLFLGWAMVRLGVIPESVDRFIFNLPVLILLVAAIFLCKKHDTMRAYLIVFLSSYLFEYVH